MNANPLFLFNLSSVILLSTCGSVSSSEIPYDSICYVILSDGTPRDLTDMCGRGQTTVAPETPQFSEASSLYNQAYCNALAQGVSPSLAIEEANLAAEIYFEIKGIDGDSFQSPFTSQNQNQVSC
jgi:hypothetical protein